MTRGNRPALSPGDLATFERFGVGADLLQEAGLRRVSDREARELLSQPTRAGDLAGIFIPYLDPTRGYAVSGRLRRDRPEMEDGKPKAKYLAAYGDHPHVYFPPGAGELLADISATVVLVEAEKSALVVSAAARRLGRRLLAIGLGGCWGWRTSRSGKSPGPDGGTVNEAGAQPDLDHVTWPTRDAVILFDSNAATTPKVQTARRALAADLARRGAKVRIGTVPYEPGVNGPDDYRATHDDHELLALFNAAVPVQPQTVEELLDDVGFAKLAHPVDLSQLERVLRELAHRLGTADPTRRKIARSAALGRLKALKLQGATQIVDAAFGQPSCPEDTRPALVQDDDPHPNPVEGPGLLEDLVQAIERFVVLPSGAAVAVALWIVHSYAMTCWSVSPLLAIVSPTKRCGKTTLLLLLNALTRRALAVANLTPAVLFRVIDEYKPTLLSDEADTWLTDEKSELRGIFNSGHSIGAAVVPRCVGDDHEVKLFSTWAAKAIAMIGRPPDTIQDRSILIGLQRKTRVEHVARLRLDQIREDLAPLRQRMRRWTDEHANELRAVDPPVPQGLHDRAADNWRPLLGIADVAGGDWATKARAAAAKLGGTEATEEITIKLLEDIRAAFEAAGDPDEMFTKDIIKRLVDDEDGPWVHWSKDKPLNAHKLARLLKGYGIFSGGTVRVGMVTGKGYRRAAFDDAWSRYLPNTPPPEPSHRNNPNETRANPPFSDRHNEGRCDDSKSEDPGREHCHCDDVTVPAPLSRHEDEVEVPYAGDGLF